jgi:hypothetical protein
MRNEKKSIKQFEQELINQYNESKVRVEQLFNDLSHDMFNENPIPAKWSIAQNMNHINITCELYRQRLTEVLETPDILKQGNKITKYGPRFLMSKFFQWLEPPVTFLFKAPNVFLPNEVLEKDVIFQHYHYVRECMLDDLKAVIEKGLLTIKVKSPASSFLSIQLGEVFLLMAAHDRRHIWTAEQIRKNK